MAKKSFNLTEHMGIADVSYSDTKPDLQMIDIDSIVSNEANFYELSNLKPLADSILLDGLQQPLVVTPIADGKYKLLSGHRRRAAIASLVDDAKDPHPELRVIPCMVRSYESGAMAELQLILANSTARVLTPAEISKQAERVEMLMYELKESGYEFPGRMRDYVAKACNVSASKLARLKVIREKLLPDILKHFESGELNESTAYEIAKWVPSYQEKLAVRVKNYKSLSIYEVEMLKTNFDKYFGPGLHCKNNIDPKTGAPGYCEHGYEMWELSKNKTAYDMCRGCCMECYKNEKCEHVCPKCHDALADKRQEYKESLERRKKENAESEAKREAETNACKEVWLRVAKVCEDKGKDFCELGANSDSCYWWDADEAGECLSGNEDDYAVYDVDVLITIADACDCSIDYLLGRTDVTTVFRGGRTDD